MLIHVGDDRNERIDLGLAAIMSAVAGALNAVGFQVAGLFSANMTGNVSALAEHAAQGSWASSAAFAALIGCFVTGASCAAGLIHLGETAQARPIYALVILGEALLLLLMMLGLGGGGYLHGDLPFTAALSFVMGLQNATTTMISRTRVRTTHVSGMATDIGIEIASLFFGSAARRLALPKLRLHGTTILTFAAGGVLGTLVYAAIGAWLFGATAAVLLAVSVPEILRAARGPQP